MSLDPRCSMLAGAFALALALPGCNFDQQGIPPEPATLNFPLALALSPEDTPRHLFVVNSNFDLRFNDGTLMALDLEAINDEIDAAPALPDERDPCGTVALGPCQFDDISRFIAQEAGEVGIGSHGDGLAVAPNGRRLYIPSRSSQDLTFVDFNPDQGTFFCEAEDVGGDVDRCAESFRTGGEGGVTSERELVLDGDPVDVAAGNLADIGGADRGFALLALREGQVALFVEEDSGSSTVPTLTHILEGFPENLVTLSMQPGTGVGWMTSATTSALARVGIAVDPENPLRSYLYDAGAVRLGGIDDGQDNRDLAFDPDAPGERAFVLSRRPESLVELDLTRRGLNASDVAIDEIYEVGAGPSRLALADIGGRRYAIASTFDARKLFFFDVERGTEVGLVAVLGGLSGPFAMVVDSARQRLYLADFSVSVIRVIDLEPLIQFEEPFLSATLGEPAPVEGFGS